jgi:hypothetical protein
MSPARKSIEIPQDIQAMSLEQVQREYQAYEQPERKREWQQLVDTRDRAQDKLMEYNWRQRAITAHYAAMLAERAKPKRKKQPLLPGVVGVGE